MPLVARRASVNVTDGGSGGGGASLELPTIEDIGTLFTELREIGHGSFGAVYYAKDIRTHDVVAIKKMSFSGKQSEEKWQDIVREVRTLSQLHHANVVEYKGCYLVDSTAWLAMEYCIGSAADLLEVHHKPLREDEISAICSSVLQGLDYLHGRNIIHRDIKAANVLLTDPGFVKIGDFGSASLSSPANSFLGTPYWMAPEVILAMDDGHYDGRADIWSLGITCIELSELKPPLFSVNAMSALYHIAQNPAPTLASISDWSAEYRNFVTSCLQKDATSRPTASALLNYDAFIAKCADGRCHPVILDLVRRTKHEVREMDKENGKRIRKILMAEESVPPCIILPTDPNGSDAVGGGRGRTGSSPVPSLTAYGDDRGGSRGRCDSGGWPGDDSSLDAQSMGGISAASSISSRDLCRNDMVGTSTPTNYASSPISVRRQPLKISVSMPGSSGATLEPPGSNLSTVVRREASRSGKKPVDADTLPSSSSTSHHSTGGPGSFATIRPSSVVEKQRKVYAGDSTTVEQMALYKRMRRQHQTQLLQLEQKYKLELLDHQNKLDKESEVLESAYEKDTEKLRVRRESELAKKAKQIAGEEQQAVRQVRKQQKQELEVYTKEVHKAAKQRADLRKLQEQDDVRKHRDTLTRSDKENTQVYIQEALDAKVAEQNHDATVQLRRFQRSKMIEYYQLEQALLKEEFGRMQVHLENQHEMSLRHHDSALELEQRQLAGLQRARADQMAQQHSAELHNQKQYTDKCEREMRKRHLLNTKRLPQSLKDKEAQLKKQFQEEVRAQDRLYKAQKEKLQASPSPSPTAGSLRGSGGSTASLAKEAVRQLREEYDRRVSAMYTQYQQSLTDMLQQQTERVDESRITETEELRCRLQEEYKQLTSYQEKMRAQMDALHSRERDELQRSIANRKAAIDRRREEDSIDYVQRRSTAMGELRDKHGKQLEAFDRETKALGISDDVDHPKPTGAAAAVPGCHPLVETPVREPTDRSRSMYLNHRVSASVTSGGGSDNSPVRFSTHL